MNTPLAGPGSRRPKRLAIIATLLLAVATVVVLVVMRPTTACATCADGATTVGDIPPYVPSLGAESARLAVLGDVGTGDANEQSIADLVAATVGEDPYDALVLLGDNVYPAGDPARLDDTVFNPFSAVLDDGTVLLPVLGNHDVLLGHANGQVEALGMPGRWYSTVVGPATFIGLDSNLVQSQAQTDWLESTLDGADTPWVIVAMHHPAYSVGVHGSTEQVQKRWVPLFEKYGVDLVLAGHDHDYQRTMPINGVTYVVSGGGSRARPTGDADLHRTCRLHTAFRRPRDLGGSDRTDGDQPGRSLRPCDDQLVGPALADGCFVGDLPGR